MQQWTVTEPFVGVKCQLGEGPYYNTERNELRWLDIYGHKLHLVDLSKGPSSLRSIDTKLPVGVTADIDGVEHIILTGSKDGITKFNLSTGEHQYLAKWWAGDPGERSKTELRRANDGAVDSTGRFWVETFEDPNLKAPAQVGNLYRFSNGQLDEMETGMTIPNGISWTAKDDTMYLTDSPAKNVYAYDFDSVSGNISNKRVFFHLDEDCVPDGHAMDLEGNIWHACYGGSKVIRISSQGKVTGVINLPTRNITCPVFAGTSLFITSAKESEPDKHPHSAEHAGCLFKVDVGIGGMPKHKAKLA